MPFSEENSGLDLFFPYIAKKKKIIIIIDVASRTRDMFLLLYTVWGNNYN